VKRVTDERSLEAALRGKKAVVLFHATWCPFCTSFVPSFVKATSAAPGYEVIEAVIDEDENPLWDKLSIAIVPTVIFFEDGKPVRRLDGKAGVGLKASDLERALAGR